MPELDGLTVSGVPQEPLGACAHCSKMIYRMLLGTATLIVHIEPDETGRRVASKWPCPESDQFWWDKYWKPQWEERPVLPSNPEPA